MCRDAAFCATGFPLMRSIRAKFWFVENVQNCQKPNEIRQSCIITINIQCSILLRIKKRVKKVLTHKKLQKKMKEKTDHVVSKLAISFAIVSLQMKRDGIYEITTSVRLVIS